MYVADNKTRWLVRAFLLALLLLLGAFFQRNALSQDRGGENNADQVGTETEGVSTGRTDDPLGRVIIPLSESDPLPSNLAEQQTGEPANQLSSAEAMKREAEAAAIGDLLVIPAAEFSADGANPDSMFFPFGSGYFHGDSEHYGCLVAPAYLPHGVTVREMFVSLYDNDASFNVYVDLRRADNFNGGAVSLASTSTTGSYAGIQVVSDISIDSPMVIYPDYSYYVTTCLQSGSIRLYSVRLYYNQP